LGVFTVVRIFIKLLVVGVVFGAGLHFAKQFPKRDGIPGAMPVEQAEAEGPRRAVSLHMSTTPESSPAFVPDLTPVDASSSPATAPPVVHAPLESALDDITPPPDLPSRYVPREAPSPDDLEEGSPFEPLDQDLEFEEKSGDGRGGNKAKHKSAKNNETKLGDDDVMATDLNDRSPERETEEPSSREDANAEATAPEKAGRPTKPKTNAGKSRLNRKKLDSNSVADASPAKKQAPPKQDNDESIASKSWRLAKKPKVGDERTAGPSGEPIVSRSKWGESPLGDLAESPVEKVPLRGDGERVADHSDDRAEFEIADEIVDSADLANPKGERRRFQEDRGLDEEVDHDHWQPAPENTGEHRQVERQGSAVDTVDRLKPEGQALTAVDESIQDQSPPAAELASSFRPSTNADLATPAREEPASQSAVRVAQAEPPSRVAFVNERPMAPLPPQTPRVHVHTVVDGDSLPTLATRYLGRPDRYMEIYAANRDQLSHPAILPIGMNLIIPLR
jgi:hypothetical protein